MSIALPMESDMLQARLAQAVAWCTANADLAAPARCLRTADLRPRLLAPTRADVVRELCQYRELLVRRIGRDADQFSGLAQGRLLVYFPDADLTDGAAELETHGYFDVCNTPPWDSWVALFEDLQRTDPSYRVYLLAFVPRVFVALAQRGIEVNPESCIQWLDESDVGARAHLSPLAQ